MRLNGKPAETTTSRCPHSFKETPANAPALEAQDTFPAVRPAHRSLFRDRGALRRDFKLSRLVTVMADHTPTPWSYRPREHDDWGWIRGPDGSLAATARSASPHDADEHRTNGTDPYEPNAVLIVKAVNNHALLEDFALWVECWVSNPVGAYSVCALEGLFEMTRDRIAALASIKERA